MKRTDTSSWPCTIARASVIFGDAWNLLILREAFYGNRRFDQLQEALGIGRNILTDRLTTLVDEGLLERAPYQQHPPRYEYLLTLKGQDAFPVLLAMATWGRAHTLGPDEDPLIFEHATCGHDFDATIACSHCGELVRPEDTGFRRGPGYPDYDPAETTVRTTEKVAHIDATSTPIALKRQ
ncbi:winged helix-turn-helix transcriptional regulator [Microbacterium sp. P02]|uniref:winged helix-turn-helix transcriptional regulator n=1 Tax=Microbacterium sp. P02 TaxID=3366260 RepID=UPI00366FA4A5